MGNMDKGRYRWRTWLRGHLPAFMSPLVPKGQHDCGAHEWYRADADTWRCYHCEVGVTHENPWPPTETIRYSLAGLLALVAHPRPESKAEVRRLMDEVGAALDAELSDVRHVMQVVKAKTGVTSDWPLISA